MNKIKVIPSQLKGTLELPPSKSHTLRAILLGSLGKGKTIIHQFLNSPDTHAMIRAMQAYGIKINEFENHLEILGANRVLKPCENIIDAGNSGIVLRFVGAIAGLSSTYTVITGDYSIRHRRIAEPLLSGLKQLKGFAESYRQDNMAPIIIRGPIESGSLIIDGEDSQPVSGLILAASFLEGTTQINVRNPGEKPWIDMTLHWIRLLGGEVINNNYNSFIIKGSINYEGFECTIPGDFSSAAFLLVAALITNSELTIQNVNINDVQGDKKIIFILQQMGAQIEINKEAQSLKIAKSSYLKGIPIDANDFIDALPILAVLGCYCEGKTHIYNAKMARQKESDRIFTISNELKKMGAQIEELEDGLIIFPSTLKGSFLSVHLDHRIVMALIVAGLGAKNESCVEGIECIKKSYPLFISDLQKLRAQIKADE